MQTDRMSPLQLRPKGNALAITILVALIMVISLLSITTSLTVGNRQVATNQGLANRAQFAAESGLLRGLQGYQTTLNYLRRQCAHREGRPMFRRCTASATVAVLLGLRSAPLKTP